MSLKTHVLLKELQTHVSSVQTPIKPDVNEQKAQEVAKKAAITAKPHIKRLGLSICIPRESCDPFSSFPCYSLGANGQLIVISDQIYIRTSREAFSKTNSEYLLFDHQDGWRHTFTYAHQGKSKSGNVFIHVGITDPKSEIPQWNERHAVPTIICFHER